MKTIRVNTVEELEALSLFYSEDGIFRGQSRHYESENGFPSIMASFDRTACIPSEMNKWSRFSAGVINYWIKEAVGSLEISQAVLQHYGWRSFYVDLSSKLGVAAWFAGHEYNEKSQIEMCEDCYESPVWLRKKSASYSVGTSIGNIYVLNKDKLSEDGLLVDLEGLEIEAKRPRFRAQSAWLAGPLRGKIVSSDYFLAHITAPHEVLAEYAKLKGLSETSDLFPSIDEDPVLRSLLDLPWLEIPLPDSEVDIPAFRRVIEFPDYYDTYKKILPANIALYRGELVSESQLAVAESPRMSFQKIPDLVMFGSPQPVIYNLPHTFAILEVGKIECFEVDTLVRQEYALGGTEYCKGIALQKHADNLVEISELVVNHLGMVMIGAGLNRGWYYQINEAGIWSRVHDDNECPCADDHRHEYLFGRLTILEDWLMNPDGGWG